MTSRKLLLILLVLLLSLNTAILFAQRTKSSLSAGEQRHAERSLKNARYFIEFLDSTITNSGSEEEKKIYLEAIRRDTISRIMYMKFAFHESFAETKKSHLLLIDLFKKTINREIDSARSMLNRFAAEVLRKRERQSRKYIALGYRSIKWSEKTLIMADNLPERNYSIRIYEYVNSLKRAKYAKRYAILSLIHSRVENYNRLKIDYRGYENVKKHIITYLPEMKDEILNVHRDNYYQLTKDSQYLSILKNPGLDQIPEYKNYLRDH